MVEVRPLWRMGGMVVAHKYGRRHPYLAYWCHGGTDVLIGSSFLTYGWHGVHAQEWYKSINFGICGMAVACKNDARLSVYAYGWHGGCDVLIGPSILEYGWHGDRVQEWHNSIHFGYGFHGGRVQEWQKSSIFGVLVALRSRG
jgi:hypothetical protein